VGDAGDEVADVVGSGELGHVAAVAEATGLMGSVGITMLFKKLLSHLPVHSAAYVDGEVGRGIDSSELGGSFEESGQRFDFGIAQMLLCFIDKGLSVGHDFNETFGHTPAFRAEGFVKLKQPPF